VDDPTGTDNTDDGFDEYRRALTDDEVEDMGLVKTDDGVWVRPSTTKAKSSSRSKSKAKSSSRSKSKAKSTDEAEHASPAGRELPSPKAPMAVARVLVKERYSNGYLLMRSWRGGFWEWTGTHWAEVEERHVESDAYSFTEHTYFQDEDGKTKPWAPNRYKIADLLAALRAVCHLREKVHPPEWIVAVDAPPAHELVAVTNGLLHVPTRELPGHDPRLFNLTAVPFAYDETAPSPQRWLRFLGELWPEDAESISTLQQFFGYVISGRTDHHKILLLIGPTRAGKGVIARILKALVGDGNHAGPTLASLGTNFGLQPLIGKPLAIVSDARLGGANTHHVVERLLSVSGEDMLAVDRKYRDPWTGTLPTRFLVISNELPRFGDASGAIANRFVTLMLSQSWLGKENTKLTNELLEELPGILNWALDGLQYLEAEGRFTEPKSSQDAMLALQDLVSPVSAFVRECCDKEGEIDCKVLYLAWKAWAEDHGHRVGSAATFGRDLRAVIPGLRVVRPEPTPGAPRPRYYQGIQLRSSVLRPLDGGGRSESVQARPGDGALKSPVEEDDAPPLDAAGDAGVGEDPDEDLPPAAEVLDDGREVL
jgi:putative DNA primase/helicase